MPIYEYRCLGCGQTSEFLITSRIQNKDLACKHCGSTDLVKIMSAGNYKMKHGGGNGKSSSRCNREQPCCGAKTRCETPPCRS